MRTMQENKIYIPEEDPYFARPYIDVEEWRDTPLRHLYVHGGFEGTKKDGTEVKFCFYFPEKEKYEGRFYQYVSAVGEEDERGDFRVGEEKKGYSIIIQTSYGRDS